MTRKMAWTLRVLFLAFVLVGSRIGGVPVLGKENPKESPDNTAQTYTGILKSGFVGIGGEHTGWALLQEGARTGQEVDIGKVLEEAKKLDGKRVKIVGRLVDHKYVERGRVKILVVESIAPGTEDPS